MGTLLSSWLAFGVVTWETHSYLAPAERAGQWKCQCGIWPPSHYNLRILGPWPAPSQSKWAPFRGFLGHQSRDMLKGPGQGSCRLRLPPCLLSPGSAVQARFCWVGQGKPEVSQEPMSLHKEGGKPFPGHEANSCPMGCDHPFPGHTFPSYVWPWSPLCCPGP